MAARKKKAVKVEKKISPRREHPLLLGLTQSEFERFEHASALVGESTTEFVRQAAHIRAREVGVRE